MCIIVLFLVVLFYCCQLNRSKIYIIINYDNVLLPTTIKMVALLTVCKTKTRAEINMRIVEHEQTHGGEKAAQAGRLPY